MKSIWTKTTEPPSFPPLTHNIKTDVLIIGGGMAGILCGYFLKQCGTDCVVAEAGKIGAGITKNTTAKITSQHGLIYHKLEPRAAKLYLNANQLALEKYRELCADIDCDFEEKDALVFSLNDRRILEKEADVLHRIGFNAELVHSTPLPFKTAGALKFPKQAQFHPLRFLHSIAGGLNIFENTTVRELISNIAVTDKAKIKAEKIIVATHFPFINKHGSYFMKMYQSRSYVLALENAPNVDGMYIQDTENGLSFRNYKNYLLLGGGGHKTGCSESGGNWQTLRKFAKTYFPNAAEKYAWAAQDCMTLDDIPYIGRYSGSTRDLYVSAGFNKWGMTSSMVGALVLTDMLTGRKNPYAEIFSPQRSMLKPQLAVNGFTAIKNLLTPTTKRCPHLGCALKWNPAERSWDCPCHGSRFEESGRLIDNPATGGLNEKK